MANTTMESSLRGLCPAPFYDAHNFGLDGYAAGRFCAPVPQIQSGLICCLPCPSTDYLYPQCKGILWLNREAYIANIELQHSRHGTELPRGLT